MKRRRPSQTEMKVSYAAAEDLSYQIEDLLGDAPTLTWEFIICYLTMRWLDMLDLPDGDQDEALAHLRDLGQLFIDGNKRLKEAPRKEAE
jgi:hypothetical protein